MLFQGRNMVGLTDSQLTAIRWKDLSVVMQSAMNALNPVKSIGAQFKDAMRAHGVNSREEIAARSAEVLRMVGIDPVHLRSYPHQLSGGMRQRSMIAMALLFTPELVIMDEPTSALDVVAQRSLMVQIKELQQQFGFAVIFVTHDMSLVSHFSDHLMVMYAGQVAELGPTQQLFDSPAHPYTVGLMEAFPSIRGPRRPLKGIPGSPPDLARPPARLPVRAALPQGDGPVHGRAAWSVPRRRHASALHPVRRRRGPRECLMTELTAGPGPGPDAGPAATGGPAVPEPGSGSAALLRTESLTKHFKIGNALSQRTLHAVDDVNLSVGERQIVALAGESGSGKSTIARLLAQIYKPTSGQIYFEGKPITSIRSRADRLRYSGLVPMVFQDPFASINPVFRVSHGVQRRA